VRFAAVGVTAAILAFQIFFPPRVGLANNGDFGKVTARFALHAPAEDEFAYANLKWAFDTKYRWTSDFRSDETLLAAVAVGWNKLTGAQKFDIRWMGLVHGLLFLLAMYLLQPLLDGFSRPRRVAILAAVVFVLTDFLYTGLFNTFYMDAATYVALMLAVVLFLRAAKWRRRGDALAMVAAALLLTLSKPQHAILGVWIAALLAVAGAELWPADRNGRVFGIVSGAVVLIAALVALKTEAPANYSSNPTYNLIFIQLIPNSRDADADLIALGLDASYKRWSGTHAFSPLGAMGDPAFVREFMRRTSYARIGRYYLTHPRDTWLTLVNAGAWAGRVRPPMGNFDRSSGLPRFSESHAFTVWSDAKNALLHQHGGRFIAWNVLMAAVFSGTAVLRRRLLPPVAVPAALALAAMAVTAWLEASLGDAAEIARHHLIASALVDLELVCAIAIALYRPVRNGGKKIPL